MSTEWTRDLVPRLVLGCVPLLFAVPVFYALAGSFIDVVETAHPYFGDTSGTSADAKSIALGAPLYQDPDVGYTPLTYTPLMSVIGAGLNLVVTWDGWPVVLTMLADLVLIGLVTYLAYRPIAASRWAGTAALAGALGMGAIAFWLVGFVPFNALFAPRPDHVAWAFGLTGLALVPAAAGGSRRAGVAAVVLLTLGWWTKQPASLTSIAAVIWLTLSAWRGAATWRTWFAMVGGIALIGATSFGLTHLLTDGWSTTFVVEMPDDRARLTSLGVSFRNLATSVGPTALVAAALWIAAASGHERGALSSRLYGVHGPLGAGVLGIAGALTVFVMVDAPAAVWFRQVVGSVHNQFVGLAWAFGLLAALGWRLAQGRGLQSSIAAAWVVIVMFGLSESPDVTRWLRDRDIFVPGREQGAIVFNQPAALLDYARDHLVYHPAYPGMGAEKESDLYPGQDNVASLTWSGRQPGHLVRALLNRRFDLVFRFIPGAGTGRWEHNYIWKLNELIRAKYRRDPTLPPALAAAGFAARPFEEHFAKEPLVRRPGPDPAPWMAHCFGPFEIAGISWRIAAGGGFWCRPGGRGTVLELVRTPAPRSMIRADGYQAHSPGQITIRARRRGVVEIGAAEWRTRRVVEPGSPVSVDVPAGSRGIRISASAGSHARIDLGDLTG